jgi:hypothetical protein
MARTADGGQGRQVGRVSALTTLSPVRRELQRKLDSRLRLVAGIPALGRPLAELAFIHYARWTVLRDVPAPDGSGERVPLASRYLLFESNYNGRPGDYLDAFADVIPHRLARLWGTCELFEETVQRAEGADGRLLAPWAFRMYVERNELEVLHFHAAYPDATMIDVRQALAVEQARRRAKAPGDDTLRRVVPLVIGPVPEQLSPPRRIASQARAQWQALTRRYGVYPFALLAPVAAAAAESLFERLRAWPQEPGASPLRALGDTHYARLVLVPRELKDLGQPRADDLGTPYLLYTSNHRGSAREHVGRLRAELGAVADEIWEHCPGYPGHGDPAFGAWAERHLIGTRYFVAGYPPREVDQVRRALAERERLAAALWHEGPSPEWLAEG